MSLPAVPSQPWTDPAPPATVRGRAAADGPGRRAGGRRVFAPETVSHAVRGRVMRLSKSDRLPVAQPMRRGASPLRRRLPEA